MIDTSKPMELEDGTPVKLMEESKDNVLVQLLREPSAWDWIYKWDLPTNRWSYSKKTGEFIGAASHRRNQLRLRNVQEALKLDWTKPLWTKDGRPVKLLATFPDTETFQRMHPDVVAISPDDVRLVEVKGTRMAYREDGQFLDGAGKYSDLTNTPPPPERETFYRQVRPNKNGQGGVLGATYRSLEKVRTLYGRSAKVLRITYEGSEPVEVELI